MTYWFPHHSVLIQESLVCPLHMFLLFLQPFPHKEFGEAENTRTLQDLDLIPSAALNLKHGDPKSQPSLIPGKKS